MSLIFMGERRPYLQDNKRSKHILFGSDCHELTISLSLDNKNF